MRSAFRIIWAAPLVAMILGCSQGRGLPELPPKPDVSTYHLGPGDRLVAQVTEPAPAPTAQLADSGVFLEGLPLPAPKHAAGLQTPRSRFAHRRARPGDRVDVPESARALLQIRLDYPPREETVRHRMEVYARETAPVLEHYRAAGLLREIDGTGSREDVFRRVATSV